MPARRHDAATRAGSARHALLALAQRFECLADAVLRGRGVVGQELHLQALGGQLDHVRGLVAAGPDDVGQRGDLRSLGVERLPPGRSEEHTSELQSLMRISYAVFCLKKKTKTQRHTTHL